MDRKIVFEGLSKKGNKIIIGYPMKNDAQIFCDYINALSKEKTFVRFQGEEIKLEDETKYLNTQLERIIKRQTVELLAFCNNVLIGISSIDMKDKTESHEGVLGISIAKEYRGEGIGKIFMQLIIKEAEKNMPQLRIITLGVFGNNPLAISMYEKLGFKEYGRLPKGSLHKNNYVDHIYMYKNVENRS
jgi:ribosomal protein S18 acetylase RimI-like enzyme